MRHSVLLLLVFVLAVAGRATAATDSMAGLYRTPTVSQTQVVFEYAGDLWVAARSGGEAVRLTSGVGREANPYFSPDGKWIAFTGEYDGNVDVYVIAAGGGIPRRLTWHPAPDMVRGWSADGKRVLFSSSRQSESRGAKLFTLALDGVMPEEVPLYRAEEGSFSPDGSRIAYVPLQRPFGSWKRYRGGQTSAVWIAQLSDSEVVDRVPRENTNDFNPMWVDHRVFFLSDRAGPTTLYSYDTRTKKTVQAVPGGAFEMKNASAWTGAGAGAIVYEQFGGLGIYDLKTGKAAPLRISLAGDLPEVRARLEKVGNRIFSASVSPGGVRVAFEARGEILTVPAEKGNARNLTQTPGAAERSPAWSPDGKWVAYYSDASGEYELYLRDQTGLGDVRKFRLDEKGSYYYTPSWSPDSKKIALTDKSLRVLVLDLDTGKVTEVDRDRYSGPRRVTGVAWSPDSKWLTYTQQVQSTMRVVRVYSLESGKAHTITDGMSDAMEPCFDADGKYLYFLASTNLGLNVGWRDMSSFERPVTRSAYVVVLRKDLPSPLAPESDEEKGVSPAAEGAKPAAGGTAKAPEAVRIDLEGIEQRILALPIPARNYFRMQAGKAGVLFIGEAPAGEGAPGATVHKFDLKTRKVERFLEGAGFFQVAAKGEKALFRQGQRWAIAPTAAPVKPGEGTVRTDEMEVWVQPREEWKQMYQEAWRVQRDFFYDPNLHGLDLAGMIKRYEPFLAGVSSRQDLSYLFSEMMGEFTASHLYVGGGYAPEVKRVPGGLLGADYKLENGRYRFARVYGGENWNPELRAPLTQPGVNVAAGEYLLAVNGRELRATDNVYAFFEATAGKQTLIRVGPNADGSGAREVTVTPVPSEQGLRNLAWVEGNRRKVDQLSKGRLAYVYIPDTSDGGYRNFNRYYFAQTGKQGVVVDERFNGGGAQPDYIIDYLRRPLLHFRNMREGADVTGPLAGIFGPKVMLINEYAGSGGDTFPWYFRKVGLGKLVGKRTWGGLVGGLGGWPVLMDGGTVSPPSVGFWDPDEGEWVAENAGIAPDIEVEMDPKTVREGRDPQLEKAVEVLLAELEKNPVREYKRPAFPNYHKR